MTFRNAGEMQWWMDVYKAAVQCPGTVSVADVDRAVEALRARLPEAGTPAGQLWPSQNIGQVYRPSPLIDRLRERAEPKVEGVREGRG